MDDAGGSVRLEFWAAPERMRELHAKGFRKSVAAVGQMIQVAASRPRSTGKGKSQKVPM